MSKIQTKTQLLRPQYCLEGFTLFGILGGFVDLFEGIELYQAVKREPSLFIELNQLGYENFGHAVAFDDTLYGAPVEDHLHFETCFHPDRRDTDQAAGAAHHERIDSLAEHLRYAGAFEGEFNPAAGEVPDFFNCI